MKYLAENGNKEPITGEVINPNDDLVEVKSFTSKDSSNQFVHPPLPPKATSIPNMLRLFQDEWDSLVLETFQLKEELNKTRQEQVRALYERDAAIRVVARLKKELEEEKKKNLQAPNLEQQQEQQQK